MPLKIIKQISFFKIISFGKKTKAKLNFVTYGNNNNYYNVSLISSNIC